MYRVPGSRAEHPDLLTRTRPANPPEDPWAALLVDPAAQLAELADLVERGLATPEEFERQRRKVFGDSESDQQHHDDHHE
jgi:hypothetical protein